MSSRLHHIMASYFQLVLAAKDLVDTFISDSQVLLNPGQCEWLGLRLQEAVQCARDAFPDLSTPERFEQLLKDFYLKVKDVEVLVRQCCRVKPRLVNALLFADIEESFVLKGQELHWLQTLFKFVKQSSETGLWLEGVPKRAMELEKTDDMEVMVRDLEYRASVDRAELRRNLEERVVTSASDTRLSQYLLKKLDSKSSRSSELGMWTVDPKELELGKPIGGGGSGARVYETKWEKQRFARKVFDLCDKKIFEQEAAMLAALQHPHILPMVCCSVDSQKENCSLVTEWMPDDLQSFMARRPHDAPFSLHATVDLMLQIAEGMQFLHKKRVVHRDLKSSNILVTPVKDSNLATEGFVWAKVADFGLSKTKVESAMRSQLTVNVGTTRWMAPELLGTTNSDNTSSSILVEKLNHPFKVDVYSYAITCYEALTGRTPYHDVSTNAEVRMKVKNEYLRPELPATCPIGLVTLIKKCWHEDPIQRPSFAEVMKELRHIKGQLLMGEPPSAIEPFKTVAGVKPSACSKALAKLMKEFRKFDCRPTNQRNCNELKHIQGLLITENITVEEAGGPCHAKVALEGGMFAVGGGGGSQGQRVVASRGGYVGAQGNEEECFQLTTSCLLFINRGDITKWCIDGDTDAIVNPTDKRMSGCGGVDAAIHKAAGVKLNEACKKELEGRKKKQCAIGSAIITSGFKLPAACVVHTVGPPVYEDDDNIFANALIKAYKRSMEVAVKEKIKYLAFPDISSGVYGFPENKAAILAVRTLQAFRPTSLLEVHFVLSTDSSHRTWVTKAEALLQRVAPKMPPTAVIRRTRRRRSSVTGIVPS